MHPVALVTRTLADLDSAYIIGSATNLWLDGEPTEAQLVNYFADGRSLDCWVHAKDVRAVTGLVEALTLGWSWNANKVIVMEYSGRAHSPYMRFYGQFAPAYSNVTVRLKFELHIYSYGATVSDVLLTMAADITANMKYVHKGQVTGILPSAIPDSRERRLIWLGTCSRERRTAIEQRRQDRKLVAGWYETCKEPPPEPWTGVLSGWRCYKLKAAPGDPGILQGDAGRYWRGTRFQAECNGAYTGPNSPDSPNHMQEHSEAQNGGACGIYMQFKPRINHGNWQVYASCVAWGNVHLYTDGARCQYVRIEKLYVMDTTLAKDAELLAFLERVYQVPVVGRVPLVPMEQLWDGGKGVLPTEAEFLGVDGLWDDRESHR